MKLLTTSPEPPDNPEKENGPPLSANIETDQVSENARQEDSDDAADSQVEETEGEIVSFDSNIEDSPAGSTLDDSDEVVSPKIQTPESILGMRLPASELEGFGTKLVRPKIIVSKPPKDQFVRVKSGADYWIPFGLLEVDRTSSFYLVAPGAVRTWMLEEGIKSFFDCILCLAVTRHGEPRVWPLKQTDNPWHATAREIAEMAKKGWVKLVSDQTAGYYVAGTASNQSKKPAWPEESFGEILEKAFAGRIIDSLDHEVIKELRGDD